LWTRKAVAVQEEEVLEGEDTAEGSAEIDTTDLRLVSATVWISDHPVRLPQAPGSYLIEASA
jgi:hypothetical protein